MYLRRRTTVLIMKFESDIKETYTHHRIKCSISYNGVSEMLNFDRYVCQVSTKLFFDAVSQTSFFVTNIQFQLLHHAYDHDYKKFSPSLFARVIEHCSHQLSAAIEHTTDVGETRSTRDTRATGGVFSMSR